MAESKDKQTKTEKVTRPRLTGALALAATAVVAAPGPALADAFLKLDDVQGESTDAKHRNEIDILSFTQSFINTASVHGAGKVSCGPITLTKNIDKSSAALLQQVATGRHYKEGVLTFRSNNGSRIEYYTINLRDVIVSELTQTDNPDPNRIVEKVVLKAAEFKFKYTPQTSKGSTGQAVEFGWDCTTGSATD